MGSITSLDAIVYTYLVGLGEFNMEYKGPNKYLCWTFFLFATIANLIVFMNMIIA